MDLGYSYAIWGEEMEFRSLKPPKNIKNPACELKEVKLKISEWHFRERKILSAWKEMIF